MTGPNKSVELEVEFLPASLGGRSQPPFLNNQRYRPHLRVPPDNSMLGVEFIEGPNGPVPVGTPVLASVRLVYEPNVSYASLKEGCGVEILEGPHVVGHGRVVRG